MSPRSRSPRLPFLASAALLAVSLVAAVPAPAPAGPRLAKYAPASTNIYVEVDDPDKLHERILASPLMKFLGLEEFEGAWKALEFEKPSFAESHVEALFSFDVPKWWVLREGAVAFFNTDLTWSEDLEVVSGGQPTEGFHYDAVMAFEFPKAKADEVRALFREAIEKIDAAGERDRARVGKATVETHRVKYTMTRTYFDANPDWTEEMPVEQYYVEKTASAVVPLVFEFAVLDEGVALFGEGTNQPVTRALEASARSGETLDRKPRFREVMELFAEQEGSDAGVVGYVDFEAIHRFAEHGATPEALERRARGGIRAALDAALQFDVTPERSMFQVAVGFVPERRGVFRLFDHLAPVTSEAFAGVPEGVASATAFGLNLGTWLREFLRELAASDPQVETTLAFLKTQGQLNLGIDPLEDLAYRIGGTHLLSTMPPAAANEPGPGRMSGLDLVMRQLGQTGSTRGVALHFGTSDSTMLAERLSTLAQKAVQLAGREVITTERTRGVDVHTLLAGEKLEVPFLSFAAANGFLSIAPEAEQIARALAVGAGEGKPLARERGFRRMMRRVPPDAVLLNYTGDTRMSGAKASQDFGTLIELFSAAGLYDGKRIGKAYEAYSDAETTKETIDFGLQGRSIARRAGDRLFLRAEYFPVEQE